jgi:PIN domain nuclease of toxin-antitoxin system
MRLLLDTHTFIWLDSEPDKLSHYAFVACKDRTNTLLLSVASIWEMQIKLQIGKLTFSLPLEQRIASQQQANNVQLLPIVFPHVLGLDKLPLHHRDPFDRLLVAQANAEDAVLVSSDPIFSQYNVQVVW